MWFRALCIASIKFKFKIGRYYFYFMFLSVGWIEHFRPPNALLPLGWMHKTKLTLSLSTFIDVFCCCSCGFGSSIKDTHSVLLHMCSFEWIFFQHFIEILVYMSFILEQMNIIYSTVNIILFNKQVFCLLLWIIFIFLLVCLYPTSMTKKKQTIAENKKKTISSSRYTVENSFISLSLESLECQYVVGSV